jgi:hypothetical protein
VLLWVTTAFAGEAGCDEARLSALRDELRGLPPGRMVAASAAALADACRGWNDVLEAAGDVAVVSPERRRALDLEVAKHDDRWLEACPDGAGVLSASLRMTRTDGRAAVWDGCGLDRLQAFERQEWIDGLDGLLVLPIAAAVLLPEVGIDAETRRIVVRGLAGLPPVASPPKPVIVAELAAAPVVPPPAPAIAPAAIAPDPTAATARTGGTVNPSVVTDPPGFLEGGQASVRWSREALVTGGTCVTRIRVDPTGALAKLTFLECPEPLQTDVSRAAEQSRYRPALAGEYPATGAFRARWTVPGSGG